MSQVCCHVIDEATRPLALGNAVTDVLQLISDPPHTHDRTRFVYDQYSEHRDRTIILTRTGASLLAQLYSGHSNLLCTYRHFIDLTTLS